MLNGVIILEDGTFQQIGNITQPELLRRALFTVLVSVENEIRRLEEEQHGNETRQEE